MAALTGDGHAGRTYELTGPRLLTFGEAAAEIGAATGRDVRYTAVPPREHGALLERSGLPGEVAGFLTGLFGDLLDGRNAHVTDDVRRVPGRARAARLRRLRARGGRGGGMAGSRPSLRRVTVRISCVTSAPGVTAVGHSCGEPVGILYVNGDAWCRVRDTGTGCTTRCRDPSTT